jgi:hypothetical protein
MLFLFNLIKYYFTISVTSKMDCRMNRYNEFNNCLTSLLINKFISHEKINVIRKFSDAGARSGIFERTGN